MASPDVPTRLVICVDGTYCTPDGTDHEGHGNITNVYRVFAAVKTGLCFDTIANQTLFQRKTYHTGIGSADEIKSWERLRAGISGDGYKTIISNVYKECCELSGKDEVWLYGFSRGAYIVRAVAGLLHYLGALNSVGEPDFDKEYSRALKVYTSNARRSRIGPGQFHSFLELKTKPAPRIHFVGVFDTVKAVNDGDLHDISFNDSIQHLRHALALNENREAMKPEYVFPDYGQTKTALLKRSIIQAWFVGAHIDIGGSAEKDGLSLYPLQWMLIESESNGLVLEFSRCFDKRAPIDDPLRVVFPHDQIDGKGCERWTCTTKNQITISMQDLRKVHESPNYRNRYNVKLNRRKATMWPKKHREPFDQEGRLRGYCTFGPQGTIIHPSVYQLLDEYSVFALTKEAMPDRENVEIWRPKMLGEKSDRLNMGFWIDREDLDVAELKSIRILVCGTSGVGKSTLINRVFGVSESTEVTKSSDRTRGVHHIKDEITHEGRPDLIIHDSEGFEAGDESQIRDVEEFFKDRASQTQLQERLHVIWFCVEMNSSRTKQTATSSLFEAIARYATDVPIIVVATKKDEFRGVQREHAEELYSESISDPGELYTKCLSYATEEVKKRIETIESEMQEVGKPDACVGVAKNDRESIEQLNRVTLENVNNEKIRLIYVAAQVASIDLKIDFAVMETMKVYRKVLGTTMGLAAVPAAATANRTAAAVSVCKEIVKCFGLPTLTYSTIQKIVQINIWDDLGHNISIAFAEGIATFGLLSTLITGGFPIFLAAGAVNIPLVIPATTRLMLMLASDLILILTRAFKDTALTCIGQPQYKDVERAAIIYRNFSGKVHRETMKLVPRRDIVKSIRYGKVELGLGKIIHRYKQPVMDARSDLEHETRSSSSDSDDVDVHVEMAKMKEEMKAAGIKLE